MLFTSETQSELEVAWKNERILIDLPPRESNARLADLKAIIHDRTGIPPSQMKLIQHGFQLKDDLPLERYHLYDEDEGWTSEIKSSGLFKPLKSKRKGPQRIVLIGSPATEATVSDRADPTSAQSRAPAPASKPSGSKQTLDEVGTISRIGQLRDDALRQHLPTIEALEQGKELPGPKADVAANELLLQALLAFDSLTIKPEWERARRSRKEAVGQVQAALDRLDTARNARGSRS